MARSAREIIDEHVWGGQAKLAAYRKQTQGSGVYNDLSKGAERDAALLQSLLSAQALMEAAQWGVNDMGFRAALQDWAAREWGGFYDRGTMKKTVALAVPREPLRG